MDRGSTISGILTIAWTTEDLPFLICQKPIFIWRHILAPGCLQSCCILLLFHVYVLLPWNTCHLFKGWDLAGFIHEGYRFFFAFLLHFLKLGCVATCHQAVFKQYNKWGAEPLFVLLSCASALLRELHQSNRPEQAHEWGRTAPAHPQMCEWEILIVYYMLLRFCSCYTTFVPFLSIEVYLIYNEMSRSYIYFQSALTNAFTCVNYTCTKTQNMP